MNAQRRHLKALFSRDLFIHRFFSYAFVIDGAIVHSFIHLWFYFGSNNSNKRFRHLLLISERCLLLYTCAKWWFLAENKNSKNYTNINAYTSTRHDKTMKKKRQIISCFYSLSIYFCVSHSQWNAFFVRFYENKSNVNGQWSPSS